MANQQFSSTSVTNDVFISCDDTRIGFVDNLQKALNGKGIKTYIDDKEHQKEEITQKNINVIPQCRIVIIVLSNNYAASSFRLEELAFIIDNNQQNHGNQFIFPIFYNIDPSIVRRQRGSYGIAMENHERDNNENTVKWRNALTKVAELSGWHIEHGYGNEQEIIGNIIKQVYSRLQRDPIRNEISDVDPEVSQSSQSVPGVSQTAHKATKVEMAWRVVGLMSSAVGLICYALSPSFNRLIGRWKPFKVFLYVVLFLAIVTTVLSAKQSSLPKQHAQFIKTCTIFVVLMIISVYSFFYDRAVNGKPDILSVVSNAAFALVSLSLHKLFKFESEIGIFSYFLCCFTVQLLTINWMLIFVAIIYGCILFVMHSKSQPSGGQDDIPN